MAQKYVIFIKRDNFFGGILNIYAQFITNTPCFYTSSDRIFMF